LQAAAGPSRDHWQSSLHQNDWRANFFNYVDSRAEARHNRVFTKQDAAGPGFWLQVCKSSTDGRARRQGRQHSFSTLLATPTMMALAPPPPSVALWAESLCLKSGSSSRLVETATPLSQQQGKRA